ncbi:MAG: D-alanyl-D-alanine carboxypeptidase/D-alanyl-D-alanine-endopeptidase [Xanthomonadales bacterium]|nr:D-alanyl-D-alanine carboxypeptidase/D-alanyl-D-alanine-endopeptidase [Xanthomonadales bacterium]
MKSQLIAYRRHLALTLGLPLILAACASAPTSAINPTPPAPSLTTAPAPLPPPPPIAPSVTSSVLGTDLAANINAFIAQPRFAHAHWGIDVVDPHSGQTIYAPHAHKLTVPASNAKLYSTALALVTLGADARFATTLYATALPRRNGVLKGDVILHGGGDPSLGDAAVAPASMDWADQFAAALAAHGIFHIQGDLIADDTWFQGPGIGSGWEAGDLQQWYAARTSALSVQGNVVIADVTRQTNNACCKVALTPPNTAKIYNLTHATTADDDGIGIYRPAGSNELFISGSLRSGRHARRFVLAAPDPAMMAAQLLHDAMTSHGIELKGRVRVVHWPQVDMAMQSTSLHVIAQIQSPPLRDLIYHTLKHSDNLYAQILLLQTGVATAQAGVCMDRMQPPRRSEAWGLCAMRAMLRSAGIGNNEATFVEGAGLSRKDLVTPAATTKLLRWISQQRFATVIDNALPIAGVDGTLAHRLRNTLAQNNLRGKTGTLTHAYALSGYVTNADGQARVFSLSLDQYQRPRDSLGRRIAPSPQSDLDVIAAMLAAQSAMPPSTQQKPSSP